MVKTPYFQVANNHVKSFADSPPCLQNSKNGGDYLSISKKLPVSRAGKFSFIGKAHRGNGTNVRVVLTGLFVASTKAKLSLKIKYKGCGIAHYTVHWIAP